MDKWVELLSKSQFGIEQKADGAKKFYISQSVGTQVYYSSYIMSYIHKDDILIFELSLNAFLEEFDRHIKNAQETHR